MAKIQYNKTIKIKITKDINMSEKLLLSLNKRFKKPVHPFNLRNEGEKSYAMWQYEKGADTIEFFLKQYSAEEMFAGKDVLDVGCGAGGKTMYYASMGAKTITGIDVLPQYEAESRELAEELGYLDKFKFVCCDAANTSFAPESFDTIIMNDAMEHVDDPEGVLAECARILKKGGRLFVNFPPYNHPFGAHLSDLISIPWVHVFFSDKTMIKAYKTLCETVPDGEDRKKFRISEDENGVEYFSYINKMTLKRFRGIKARSPMEIEYYSEAPLRNVFKIPAKLPFFREYLVKMAVCVFKK